MKHFSFAIEDNVGNATYRRNLERFIHEVPEIRATFLPIALIGYDLWQLVPGIRGNLALAASARAASALHASHFLDGCDAALIHSQSIGLFALEFMRRVPTVISTDPTPANFDRLPGYPQPLRSRQAEWIKNEPTLFAALDRLVEDGPLRERMGLAARARVLSLFNSRKNTPQLIELMRQLSG